MEDRYDVDYGVKDFLLLSVESFDSREADETGSSEAYLDEEMHI